MANWQEALKAGLLGGVRGYGQGREQVMALELEKKKEEWKERLRREMEREFRSPADLLKDVEATETLQRGGYLGGTTPLMRGAMPEFKTEADALNSGLPEGSKVRVGGKPYRMVSGQGGLGGIAGARAAEKAQEERFKAEIKGEAKTKEAKLKADTNFGRVATAVQQLSEYYAGALDEGGAGSFPRKLYGEFYTQKWGGPKAEQLESTGKLFGQRAELALSMMPILTNQNRFIASIMDYINKSLPQGAEGPSLAAAKLEQTLRNQYAITRVLNKMGIDPENPVEIDNLSDEEAEFFAQKIAEEVGIDPNTGGLRAKAIYKFTPSEEREFEEIKQDIFKDLISRKGMFDKKKTTQKLFLKTPSDSEKYDLWLKYKKGKRNGR